MEEIVFIRVGIPSLIGSIEKAIPKIEQMVLGVGFTCKLTYHSTNKDGDYLVDVTTEDGDIALEIDGGGLQLGMNALVARLNNNAQESGEE